MNALLHLYNVEERIEKKKNHNAKMNAPQTPGNLTNHRSLESAALSLEPTTAQKQPGHPHRTKWRHCTATNTQTHTHTHTHKVLIPDQHSCRVTQGKTKWTKERAENELFKSVTSVLF